MTTTADDLRRMQERFVETVSEPFSPASGVAYILLDGPTAYLYQGHGKGQKLLSMMPAAQFVALVAGGPVPLATVKKKTQ